LKLAKARAAIEAGDFALADSTIEAVLADDPWEWRAVWLSGLEALARHDPGGATEAFNTVLGQVPGELAPKLALALACEQSEQRAVARGLYRTCTVVDANYVAPAAFGLCRCALADQDVAAALSALDLIGPTSGSYVTARRTRAEILAASNLGLPALADAVRTVEHLPIAPLDRQQLVTKVLTEALERVHGGPGDPSIQIAGVPATERNLRIAAEQSYRALAELTSDRSERVRLVDAANAVRPRTMR
jgi:serine/threonine-protein kinase PknG